MAKKKNQSLTERIAALINRVGEKPEPTFGDIKSELVECLGLAETMQDGAAVSEAESQIAVLKEALAQAEAAREQADEFLEQSDAENNDLRAALKAVNVEIETFRTERKKQEEEKKREEMPDIQFEILQRLPTEHIGDGATLQGVARRAHLPPDEAAVHLNRLVKAGFAQQRRHDLGSGLIMAWHRTIAGDELVLAKRLAGDEEAGEQEAQEAPELTRSEQLVLLAVAAGNRAPSKILNYVAEAVPTVGPPTMTEGTVLLLLVTLRGKKMVNEERISGTPSRWELSRSGRAYVADLTNFS